MLLCVGKTPMANKLNNYVFLERGLQHVLAVSVK